MKKTILLMLIIISTSLILEAQCVKGDCQNGYGKYEWKSGDSFEGTWKDGKKVKGLYEWKSGDSFEGTWKDGKKVKGLYIWSDGTKYDGQFVNGFKEGKGKWIFPSGYIYEGGFVKDKYNGYGKETFPDSTKYEGQFVMDYKEGKGKWIFPSGDIYEGEFRKDKFEGYGVMYYKDGSKFIGYWKNDKKHGKGKIIFPSGAFTEGEWRNGKLIKGTLPVPESNFIKVHKSEIIKMKKSESGIYEIPVLINGKLELEFIMDTGAADMSVTPDIFLTLIRTKTISEDDILDNQEYIDANGGINLNARFIIRSLKIGNKTIQDITCSISNNVFSPILLGQSALQKLGKFMINYDNNTFMIISE